VRRVVSWTGNSAADRTNCAKAAAYPLGKIGREAQPVAESPAHARLEQGNGTHEATIAELRSELSQGDASRRELSDQLGTIVMKAMDLKDKLSVLQRQLVAKQEEVIDLRQQLSVARREVTDLREALSKALFFPTGPAPQRHP
jgi:predicted  nucleic acid-binding Zn-ribbon protein